VRHLAQHYSLDCHAAPALNPSEAQDAARTQSAGDTRAGTYLLSIIYYLLSIIYYLCSMLYALKKRGYAPFF